jgi:hypothetical protein
MIWMHIPSAVISLILVFTRENQMLLCVTMHNNENDLQIQDITPYDITNFKRAHLGLNFTGSFDGNLPIGHRYVTAMLSGPFLGSSNILFIANHITYVTNNGVYCAIDFETPLPVKEITKTSVYIRKCDHIFLGE